MRKMRLAAGPAGELERRPLAAIGGGVPTSKGEGREGNGKREGRGWEGGRKKGKGSGGREGEGRLASHTILGPAHYCYSTVVLQAPSSFAVTRHAVFGLSKNSGDGRLASTERARIEAGQAPSNKRGSRRRGRWGCNIRNLAFIGSGIIGSAKS